MISTDMMDMAIWNAIEMSWKTTHQSIFIEEDSRMPWSNIVEQNIPIKAAMVKMPKKSP